MSKVNFLKFIHVSEDKNVKKVRFVVNLESSCANKKEKLPKK